MGKASEIWKEIKPKIGDMLMAVNNIETQAEKAQGEAYQKGLSDAWEAARKIGSNSMCSLKEMGFDFGQCVVADYNPSWFVVKNYSASECIEKIRQYEQEKEEIKVGDEVTPRETEYDDMIVTRLWKDDYDSDCIDAIGFDGRIGSFLMSRVSKTGKHYEIAEVLRKMRKTE